MTKKQENMLANYNWAFRNRRATELYEVYGNYSDAKARAMRYCKELKARFQGYDDTIVGHSCHFFSYAFKYIDYDLGGKECLCYCTHAYDYKFVIEEDE